MNARHDDVLAQPLPDELREFSADSGVLSRIHAMSRRADQLLAARHAGDERSGGSAQPSFRGALFMIALRIASGVTLHFARRLPEWLLAALLSAFGVQIERAGDAFFVNKETFAVILAFVSAETFGAIALVIGALWVCALVLNGSFQWFARWSRWVRSGASFLATGFWASMALGLFTVNTASPFGTLCAGCALLAFAVSLITAREVGAADKRARDAACRSA